MNNYLVNGSVILMGNQGGTSTQAAAGSSAGDGASTGAKAKGFGGSSSMFLMLGGLFIIMYFFMIRPQSKKQKEVRNMLSQLEKGDTVLSAGGIKGVVDNVKEDTVIVKVDDNTKLEFSKASITQVLVKKNPVAVPEKKGFSLFKKNKKENDQEKVKKSDKSKSEKKEDKSSEKKANTPDL